MDIGFIYHGEGITNQHKAQGERYKVTAEENSPRLGNGYDPIGIRIRVSSTDKRFSSKSR